jgi:hypothetical protein
MAGVPRARLTECGRLLPATARAARAVTWRRLCDRCPPGPNGSGYLIHEEKDDDDDDDDGHRTRSTMQTYTIKLHERFGGADTITLKTREEYFVGQTVSFSQAGPLTISTSDGGSISLSPGVTFTGTVIAKQYERDGLTWMA